MSQTDPTGELKKEHRRRVSEVLLVQRLGLESDWMDPDDIADLPNKLPPDGWRKRTAAESSDLKRYIVDLVAVGCNRQVLYWCLWQMSRAAHELRMGAVQKSILKEGEEEYDQITVKRPLATSDEMAEIIIKVRAADEIISRYQRELLIAAEVLLDNPRLRRDMTEFEEVTPDEAMPMLRSLLHWIKQLADAWPAPNLNTLLKSKGMLFLLAYVRMCEERSSASLRSSKMKKRSTQMRPDRLAVRHAHTIAHIALLYTGEDFHPDNLIDKLQDFQQKHLTPHSSMVSLLKTLEEVARSRSHG